MLRRRCRILQISERQSFLANRGQRDTKRDTLKAQKDSVGDRTRIFFK